MKKWCLLVLGFCLAGWSYLQAAPPGSSAEKSKWEMTKVEKRLLELTNQERKKKDLPPLKPNRLLFKAAREHSQNMAKQQKLEHILDGKNPLDRIRVEGYRYYFAGENIGFGNLPLPQVMKGWMDSKLHRENILDKKYTEIGLGVVTDSAGDSWYTQVFAVPRK